MAGRKLTAALGCLAWIATAAGQVGLPELGEQLAKILPSDGMANDRFGESLSIDGDTAVIGAAFAEVTANFSGAAYVFERNLGGRDQWGQTAKLAPANGSEGDLFGVSVSIRGDVVAVGANGDDEAGQDAGAVYVFERNADNPNQWDLTAKLIPDDAAPNERFGQSVSVGSLAIIASGDTGAAYVFERDELGEWQQQARLEVPGGVGLTVAVDADTAIVGAPSNISGVADTGLARVFKRTTMINIDEEEEVFWNEIAVLLASDGRQDDAFGRSVAIDLDTAVIGAVGVDDRGDDSGAAYIFKRIPAEDEEGVETWRETLKLTASDSQAGDGFGNTVSIDLDLLVVGAPRNDAPRANSGAAYLFKRNEGGAEAWGRIAKLTASDGGDQDALGAAVSISGDNILAGSSGDDDQGLASGSAYAFALLRLLEVPFDLPGRFGEVVEVDVSFKGQEFAIVAATFSLDYDESCLTFDPVDQDSNGMPDNIRLRLPSQFEATVTVDDEDTDGEIDFLIALPPSSPLPNGDFASVLFTIAPGCIPQNNQSVSAAIRFSADPPPSFGNSSGRSIPAGGANGSVLVLPLLRGDCNGDGSVNVADITACSLEIFDGDGTFWLDANREGGFPGNPGGCDANGDSLIDAGDVSCKIRLILSGDDFCETGFFAAALREETSAPKLFFGPPRRERREIVMDLYFAPNGEQLTSAAFSIDLHKRLALSANPSQSIRFDLPAKTQTWISYDPKDSQGEIDVVLASAEAPLPWRGGYRPLARLRLKMSSGRVPPRIGARIASRPAPSFGTAEGRSLILPPPNR